MLAQAQAVGPPLVQWLAVFGAPATFAGLWFVLSTLMGVGGDGPDADADVDADLDVDVDVDVDADVDMDADVDADADAEVHAGGGANGFLSILGLIGVGKAPISVVVVSMALIWGIAGLTCREYLTADSTLMFIKGDPLMNAMLVSAVIALVGTRFLAGLIGAILPGKQTNDVPERSLVGQVGKAVHEVSDTFGEVMLTDRRGIVRSLKARVRQGETPIPKDARVKLARYDTVTGIFLCREAK